jgi:hypothetical protein
MTCVAARLRGAGGMGERPSLSTNLRVPSIAYEVVELL